MKKILGVSFAAMLAVSPMMANAEVLTPDATISKLATVATVEADANTLATSKYVKEAYGAVKTNTDAIADKITVTGTRVDGDYIANGSDVAANIVRLNDAIKALDGDAANTYANQDLSNLSNAGTAVITNAVKTGAASADYSGANSGLTATTIQTAIDQVEGRVDTAEGTLTKLEGAVGTTGSISQKIYSEAATAEYNSQTTYDTGTIGKAISDLSGTVTGSYATQTGVAATVNAATVTANGTVATLQTWGDNTPTNLPISTSGQVVVDGYHATATSNQSSGM